MRLDLKSRREFFSLSMHLMFSDSEQRLGMMMKQQKDDKIKKNVTEARISMVLGR